jgi:hypothetical protein
MTFDPSPAAREMAEALRAGVSARLRDFDAATPDEDLAHLRALGALEEMTPVARPTAWSFAVRGVRHLLRGLMRPWLAAQTSFNRAIAERSVETVVAAHVTARRVTELERNVETLRDEFLRRAERPAPRADGPAPRLDRDTLLRLVVQSRIRQPPARVLVRGSRTIGGDLVAFGYDVVSDPGADALASSAAVFDVVVWLPGFRPASGHDSEARAGALVHLLRPGGQAIVVQDATDTTAAAVADGLAVRHRLVARDDARGWTVVEEAVPAEALRRAGSPGEIAIVVAVRPHAPDY